MLEKFGDRPIIVRTNSTQLKEEATCWKTRKGKKKEGKKAKGEPDRYTTGQGPVLPFHTYIYIHTH